MSFTPFNEDMVIIQDLNKRPNAIGGLSAAQLQAKFDEAGIKIKEYLNGTLIPELDDEHTETTQAATELDEKIDSRLLIHLVDEGAGDPLPSTQGATAMIHKDYLVAQNALLTVGDLAIGTYTGNICVITAGLDMNREFTVRATGQSILDKVADVASALENEIESVAEAPHVVWCSRTVPTAANPSAQVQIPVQYFAPTPKTGDVVIGVNNRVGRVLVVEESGGVQAATVSGGLGLAISGGLVTSVNGKEGDAWLHPADVGAEAVRTDASEQYAAAHALDASLTPEKFLSQEAEGRYVVVTDDATTYADNIVLETASVSLVQKLTASGAVEQYYYVDEALIWSRTDGDGITQLSNGVKTPIVKALALTVKTDDNHEVSLVSASNGTLLLTRDGTGLVELRNIDTPTTDGSAANKKYVDDNKTTIDDSLSVTGAAADAKATGDAVDELKSVVDLGYQDLKSGYFTLGTWSRGAISAAGNRICTKTLYPVKKNDKVYIKTNVLQIAHGIYEAGKTASTDYQTWHSVPDGAVYIVPVDGSMFFQCRKTGDASVTPSEFDATIQIFNNEIGRNTIEINQLNTVVSDTIGLNNIDLSWEQGGMESNGVLNSDTKRIRTTTAYDMPNLLDIKIRSGFMFSVKQFAGTTVVNDSGWIRESGTVKRSTTATSFKLMLAFSNNAVITPSYGSNITASPKYENIGETVDELVADVFGAYASTYYGEAFPHKVNGFNSTKLMTITYSSSAYSLNDIATYGDYILFFLNPGTIYVYQLSTKTKICEIVVGTQHFACAMFSDTFYDSSDPFPLLYADTTSGGIYNVIRFTSLTSATIIKNYKFDTSLYGISPQVSFDFINNRAYCVGYDVTTSNKYKLFTFDMKNETENQDGTFSFAEISSGTFPFYQTRQGNTFFNNRMFMAFANTTSPFNPKIVSFDCSSGNAVITSLFDTLPFTGEAEGLTIAQIDGKNCILVTDYYNVFKLDF